MIGVVRIRPEAELRIAVQRGFDTHRRQILKVLSDAEVEHVGATAVPGALTKGDLDVLVRVSASQFDEGVRRLRALYQVHQPHNWTPTLASFVEREPTDIPVGIQLVVAGSSDDAMFRSLRDALKSDPVLLAEYNAFKRGHDGEDYERYTEIKGTFIEQAVSRLNR